MKLTTLIRKWNVSRAEYVKEAHGADDARASQRYEGIATGIRWCMEDLKKLVDHEKPKRPALSPFQKRVEKAMASGLRTSREIADWLQANETRVSVAMNRVESQNEKLVDQEKPKRKHA